MSELWKIVLTAAITVLGGIAVYTLGRLFVAIFVEPIHRLRSFIGEIADSLIFYANVYGNPGLLPKEVANETSETLRRQASQLRARVYTLPWYRLWMLLGLVQDRSDIEEASRELIGLSNSVHNGPGVDAASNARRRQRIERLLGISADEHVSRTISSYALARGVLLFLFALILLGLQDKAPVIYGHQIFTEEIWFYIYPILGIIALLMSISFIAVAFLRKPALRIEEFLEEIPGSRLQAIIQYLFWVMFSLNYFSGWLKGLSSIPQGLTFHLVFAIGTLLLFVILIIPVSVRFKRRTKQTQI